MIDKLTLKNTIPTSWRDGLYSINRHGQTLITCESEPVHTPGCIQPHGALLVLRVSDFIILQASENTTRHLLEDPRELLEQPVTRVIGDANLARLKKILEQESIDEGSQRT